MYPLFAAVSQTRALRTVGSIDAKGEHRNALPDPVNSTRSAAAPGSRRPLGMRQGTHSEECNRRHSRLPRYCTHPGEHSDRPCNGAGRVSRLVQRKPCRRLRWCRLRYLHSLNPARNGARKMMPAVIQCLCSLPCTPSRASQRSGRTLRRSPCRSPGFHRRWSTHRARRTRVRHRNQYLHALGNVDTRKRSSKR